MLRARIITSGLLLAACSSSASELPNDASVAEPVVEAKHMPCEITQILKDKCWQCHGAETQETAPMSLTTWAELHVPALKKDGPPAKVFERIALRIHDRLRPMPPRDRPQLTAAELSVLDAWLGFGAPSGQACPPSEQDEAPLEADAGSGTEKARQPSGDDAAVPTQTPSRPPRGSNPPTMPSMPAAPTSGTAGSSSPAAATPSDDPMAAQPAAPEDAPVPPEPSECTFVELRARQDSDGTPYRIAADATDEYSCFVFDLAFEKPTQALAIYPLIDNEKVLHHWLLHVTDELDTSQPNVSCNTNSPDIMLLAGGTANGGDWYLPKHVGLDLGTGKFILEVHYNNIGGPATEDRSGARICTTQNLRPETAVISWLGNQLFAIPPHATNYEVSGRCKPETTRPIHVLRSWPHMHRLGTRMTMRHDRADGSSAMVFDVPFAFESQTNVDASVVLQPGDSLVTTCFYDNPTDFTVSIGERANDEMCNNFVVAYPAGALVSNWPSVSNHACLGPL